MQDARDEGKAQPVNDKEYGTFIDESAERPAGGGQDLSDFLDEHGWSSGHYIVLLTVSLAKAFCGAVVSNFPFILEGLEEEFGVGKAAVATVAGGVLVGSVAGSLAGGIVSDAFGRRSLLVAAITVGTLLTTLHMFVVSIFQLLALRSLIGFCFGCSVAVTDVYLIEFVPTAYRGWSLCMSGLGWKVGGLYGLGLAWHFTSRWRLVLSWNALPGVLALMAFGIWCPETPRWLCLHQHSQDAAGVLQKLYRLQDAPVISSISRDRDDAPEAAWLDRILKLFGTPLRCLTFACLVLWILNVGTAYSWGLWSPEIVKDLLHSDKLPYEFFMMIEVICFVVQLCFAIIVDKFSRRVLLAITYTFVAMILGLLLYVPHTKLVVFTFVLMVNLPWDLAWFSKITYTKEAFPTELRGTSAGFISGTGRISGALMPIGFGMILNVSLAYTMWAFVALLLSLAIVSATLPRDTYQMKMIDAA
eukprot:TRINITY_DN33021_c0_g1_i1.p1 TRINITY_DN33021_c0_g1~~TRINITY_DN33021_c0_g1_i1.p1  ORF type:complete len:473 (+),score=59.22 TRINITY_DN33021_c0_g1_i1:84-1502(+)